VPIFPELRPHLLAAREAAEPDATWVCRATTAANLRTRLGRIIRRAGLKPWPKLWHNLRASRQTELAEQFPSHVVCQWLGNSPAIAARHYLQTTEEHYERAADGNTTSQRAPETAPRMLPDGAPCFGKAAISAKDAALAEISGAEVTPRGLRRRQPVTANRAGARTGGAPETAQLRRMLAEMLRTWQASQEAKQPAEPAREDDERNR
jgi:hypothetical protein